jgi:hypothetical protein
MFFQLLFIHLFRPFLKYTQATSPLPHTVSPRKLCTQAAAMISKLLRLYKRSHGLRQICNIAVYIAHSACTIHLLNLPDKNARRDIIHGVKHLEEIAEGWLGARRTLGILAVLARKWNIELPEEAETVLARTDAKYGSYTGDMSSPSSEHNRAMGAMVNPVPNVVQQAWQIPQPPTSTQAEFFINDAPAVIEQMARPQTSDANNGLAFTAMDPVQPQQFAQNIRAPNQQQLHSRHRPSRSLNSRPVGNSPNGMFGGVEQLLRDSSDWTYRDQAQLATGFENWNPVANTLDPSDPTNNWMNGPTGDGNAAFPIQQRQMQPTTQPAAVMPPFSMPNNGRSNSIPDASTYSMMTWMNGANPYTTMMNYNEEEWYR